MSAWALMWKGRGWREAEKRTILNFLEILVPSSKLKRLLEHKLAPKGTVRSLLPSGPPLFLPPLRLPPPTPPQTVTESLRQPFKFLPQAWGLMPLSRLGAEAAVTAVKRVN